MSLRHTPIYAAQWRRALVLGAQRGWVVMTATVAAVVSVAGGTVLHLALGAALFVGVVAVLRAMANRDPMLLEVYLRQVRYRSRYPARATRWRRAG